jgi:hypothetical protein
MAGDRKLNWLQFVCIFCCALVSGGMAAGQAPPPAGEPAASGDGDSARRIVARIDAPPIVLEVQPAEEGALSATATISISADLAQHFGTDNPILWAPLEQQSPLTADPSDPGSADRSATLGETPSDDVQISFDRGLLIADTPRQLTVTVPTPQKLAAGVYSGQIVAHLETLRHPGVIVEHVWPVELRVTGRHLRGVQFHAAKADAAGASVLPVGQPASISIWLETVNCPLGEGILELLGPSQPGPLVRMPLPLAGPLDPRTAFRTLQNPLLKASAKEPVWPGGWGQHPLDVMVLPGAETAPQGASVKQYEVRAILPAVCEPGKWMANVTWERGERSGLLAPVVAQATVTAPAGICVSQPLAIVGETVLVQLLSREDLGPTVELVAGARNSPEPQTLIAERTAIDGAGSGAGYFDYRATFVPPALGEYSVRVATAAAQDPKLAPIPETTFRAAFQAASALNGELTLFDGSPPFWWSWQHTAEDGGVGEVTRPAAFRLLANTDHFRGLSAALVAVGRIGEGKTLTLEAQKQWQSEPQLSFPSQPGADDGKLAIYEADGAAAAAAPLYDWPASACPNNQLVIHQRLALPAEPRESAVAKAAAAHGERRYALRLLVRGEGPDGAAAARIVQVPYRIAITDSWAYYRPASIWGGAILGGLLLLAVAGWSINRRLTPAAVPANSSAREPLPVSSGDLSPEPREFSFDPAPSPTMAGGSAAAANGAALDVSPPAEPLSSQFFPDDSPGGLDEGMFRP